MTEVLSDEWFKVGDTPMVCSCEDMDVDDVNIVFSSGEVSGNHVLNPGLNFDLLVCQRGFLYFLKCPWTISWSNVTPFWQPHAV